VNPPLVSIIEDDELVREAIESLIRSIGLEAASFDSADAFLVSSQLRRTAFLISDVSMPGMSGIEMHALLISNGYAPPTVFITGHPTPQDEVTAHANGALAYLTKPIDSNVILAWIDQVLGKH
jgi:FixJ family two-component response regulator